MCPWSPSSSGWVSLPPKVSRYGTEVRVVRLSFIPVNFLFKCPVSRDLVRNDRLERRDLRDERCLFTFFQDRGTLLSFLRGGGGKGDRWSKESLTNCEVFST